MTTQVVTNWKKEWFEIEDAIYLNVAAHAVMPRVSIRAVEVLEVWQVCKIDGQWKILSVAWTICCQL